MPTLTRQELYDLVWATPMAKLAESFGLSDVGLAKICDRHRVPTPPRGYWAKKNAGKRVKETIFVEVDDPLLDRVDIAASHAKLPKPVREMIERRRVERREAPRQARSGMTAPPATEPVEEPHAAIRATAQALRRAKPSNLGVVYSTGPGLCGIAVGAPSIERTILILDRLARVCDARGLVLSPAETRLSAACGGDTVTFELNERTKRVPHVLTAAEIAADEKRRKRNERLTRGSTDWDRLEIFAPLPPKFDTVRTGELGVEIHGWGDGLRRSWRDGKMQVLETLIDEIVDGLEAHIVGSRLRREARERADAERRELERRRGLAKARRERESERKALLGKLMRAERQAAQLRDWMARYEEVAVPGAAADVDLSRMIGWARDRLATLEAVLDPLKLTEELRTRKLFPEIDELHDPLGEPPPEPRWW
jgi:hypothetical protein